jgi:hypothetical protein
MGHGEAAVCGEDYIKGVYQCDECKLAEVTKKYEQLLAAANMRGAYSGQSQHDLALSLIHKGTDRA